MNCGIRISNSKSFYDCLYEWEYNIPDYTPAFVFSNMQQFHFVRWNHIHVSIQLHDESRAYYEMDEMLDQWLTLATTVAEEHDKSNVSYTEIPKDKNDKYYQYINRNLEHYVYDDEDELFDEQDEDELDEILSELSWENGDDSTEVEGDGEEEFPMFFAGDHKTLLNKDEGEKAGSSDNDEEKNKDANGGSEEDEEQDSDSNNDGKGEESESNKKSGKKDRRKSRDFSPRKGDGSQGMGIGGGAGSKVELQNRFLSNVPGRGGDGWK